MRARPDPKLSRAIREDPAVTAEHARVLRLLALVQQRRVGSSMHKAAVVALQVAVQRRRAAYEAWALRS